MITLTDSVHSPMNLYSSCNLIARSDMASIVDSLVAPLSVINALVVALCMKKAAGSCNDAGNAGENLGRISGLQQRRAEPGQYDADWKGRKKMEKI